MLDFTAALVFGLEQLKTNMSPLLSNYMLPHTSFSKLHPKPLEPEDFSITTHKKSFFRRNTPHPSAELSRSNDFLNWKEDIKNLKPSCSQAILTVDTQEPLRAKELLNPNIAVLTCESQGGQLLDCASQDGKKAKYTTLGKENVAYCMKCAIKLLQKGVQIVEIPEADQKSKKLYKNKKLQEQLSGLLQNVKESWDALEQNYFFVEVEEERQKILQVYDKVIDVVVRMKEEDIKKLTALKVRIIKKSKEEIQSLKIQHKSIESVIKDLKATQLVSPKLREYTEILIRDASEYSPLEFSMKREEVECIKERILNKIQKQFCDREYPIHFSFNDKSSFLESTEENDRLSLNRAEDDHLGKKSKLLIQPLLPRDI